MTLNSLPCKLDRLNNMLIYFLYGNKQPKMSELPSITDALSEANHDIAVKCGISSGENIGNSYKVILVSSVKV